MRYALAPRFFALSLSLLAVGCPAASPGTDAAMVTGDAGLDAVAACIEGSVACEAGNGRQCCGGVITEFNDGPCFFGGRPDGGTPPGVDAGTLACPDALFPGCPCATEGEERCNTTRYDLWMLRCSAGTWAQVPFMLCCP